MKKMILTLAVLLVLCGTAYGQQRICTSQNCYVVNSPTQAVGADLVITIESDKNASHVKKTVVKPSQQTLMQRTRAFFGFRK